MKRSLKLFLIAAALLFASPSIAQNSVSEIPYDSAANLLKLPDNLYLGEAVGVATNSKGHIFVYTRTGSPRVTICTNRTFSRSAARLFEFDQTGKYLREIGQCLYGFVFAHAVRIDRQDNIWVIDEGSNMIIKFDPDGRVLMTLGRKPEALRVPAGEPAGPGAGRGGGAGAAAGAGIPGDNFNRPTDVAWDAAGNIFVADGYGNSRVAKFDKYGRFIKSWGSRGTAPGNFKTQYTNVGAPYAICITLGSPQYLYTSNSNPSTSMDNGEIYKMTLDGRVLGKFGTAGKLLKEFGTVHEIDCRSENEVFVGEITNWRIQKLTLHPRQSSN